MTIRRFSAEVATLLTLMLCFALIMATLLVMASGVFAADAPRKVNFQTVLTDLEGKPLNWDCLQINKADPRQCDEWQPATLSAIATTALMRTWPNEEQKADEQIRRSLLAQEIFKKEEVELTAKDTDLLCDVIAKLISKASMNTIFTYRAVEILDPARLKK